MVLTYVLQADDGACTKLHGGEWSSGEFGAAFFHRSARSLFILRTFDELALAGKTLHGGEGSLGKSGNAFFHRSAAYALPVCTKVFGGVSDMHKKVWQGSQALFVKGGGPCIQINKHSQPDFQGQVFA